MGVKDAKADRCCMFCFLNLFVETPKSEIFAYIHFSLINMLIPGTCVKLPEGVTEEERVLSLMDSISKFKFHQAKASSSEASTVLPGVGWSASRQYLFMNGQCWVLGGKHQKNTLREKQTQLGIAIGQQTQKMCSCLLTLWNMTNFSNSLLVIPRYSKVRFNSFQLNGCCFLPVMALFNHSCSPNAAITHLPPHSDAWTDIAMYHLFDLLMDKIRLASCKDRFQ